MSERGKHGVCHSSDPGGTGFVQQNACSEVAISSFSRSGADGLATTDATARVQHHHQEHPREAQVETRRRRGQSMYDVCEVFSPARVVEAAEKIGWKGGWSLDLSKK